jgi:hypothetical protein
MKLTATLPDGKITERTTEQNYTHVVAVFNAYSEADKRASRWGALSWHKSEAAARKQISGRWGKIYPRHQIIPVNRPDAPLSRNERAAAFWGINLAVIPPQYIQGS